MKILDAGTEVLDDFDVLKFIREKRAQHKKEDAHTKKEKLPRIIRPANYLRALEKHEDHLSSADKPFTNNPHYGGGDDDDDNDNAGAYLTRLMHTLQPRVALTKTEYLVLVNQRPYRRKQLTAMIEDIDTRFTPADQTFIRDAVVAVLGIKDGVEPNADAGEVEVREG